VIRHGEQDQPTSPTAKQRIRQLLDEMPDDVTYREIEYRIYVLRKIEQGMEDIRQGRLLEQEEVERRMEKWLRPQRDADAGE
jgi:predicted transcriptional regulator